MTEDIIANAIRVVNEGGIIIYPTDTAFGIGCRIDNEKSVDKLFRIRKRPLAQATPVLVSSATQALAYLDAPKDIVRHLMEAYWPGALTIIARCKTELIYSPIRGGTDAIGVREPDHDIARAIIGGVGVPILGPSANFHGEKTPFTFEDLDPQLVALADFTVPGQCFAGNVSTVLDTTTYPISIKRQGAVVIPPEVLQ